MTENKKTVFLDIRSEDEYIAGHIPGARHCPLQELTYILNDVDQEDHITVVCRTGQRAHQVKALLHEEGYHNIEVLAGGMTAYKGEIEEGEE